MEIVQILHLEALAKRRYSNYRWKTS